MKNLKIYHKFLLIYKMNTNNIKNKWKINYIKILKIIIIWKINYMKILKIIIIWSIN